MIIDDYKLFALNCVMRKSALNSLTLYMVCIPVQSYKMVSMLYLFTRYCYNIDHCLLADDGLNFFNYRGNVSKKIGLSSACYLRLYDLWPEQCNCNLSTHSIYNSSECSVPIRIEQTTHALNCQL